MAGEIQAQAQPVVVNAQTAVGAAAVVEGLAQGDCILCTR